MTMKALLDCYAGAYGLTIRFDASTLDDLVALRELFRRLSMGEACEVALHKQDNLRVSNLEALTLALVDFEPEVSLRRSNGGTFLWVNNREGWKRCSGLVDGLIEFNKPGHQYLTNEGIDDAIVEVCLYERLDSTPKEK